MQILFLLALFSPESSYSQLRFLLTPADIPDYELRNQSIHQNEIVQQWKEIDKDRYLYLNYYEFKNEFEAINWISDRSGSFAVFYYFGFPNGEIKGNSSWTTLTPDPYNSTGAFIQKWNMGVQIFFSNDLAGNADSPMLDVSAKLLAKIGDSISTKFLIKDTELRKYQLFMADYNQVAGAAEDTLASNGLSEYRIEDSKWIFKDDSLVMGIRKQWSGENSFFSIDIAKFSGSMDAQLATEQNANIKRSPFFLLEDKDSVKKAIEGWYWPFNIPMKYISVVGRTGNYAIHYYYFDEYGVDIAFLQRIIQATTPMGTGTNNIEHTEFTVYPNPATDFTILTNHKGNLGRYILFVRDTYGRQVIRKVIELQNSYQLDISGLAKGLYFLTIQNESNRITKSFIRQ